jgi:hypothetical protein
LLRAAIADSPDNTELRLEYVSAAFAAGLDARALLAAEPIFENGSFYGQRFAPVDDTSENEENVGRQRIPALLAMKQEDVAKLMWFAIRAREKRHEAGQALTLTASALLMEKDHARRHALEEEQKRLETDAARERENASRTPNIHKDLDQDRVVHRRLLPGEPFTPRKTANGEEEEQ